MGKFVIVKNLFFVVGKVVYKGIVRFNLNLLILLIHGVCGKLLYAKFSGILCSFYYCHLAKCSSIKRNTILVDWCCMCKASGKLVEYLRLYCYIARDL